MRGRKWDSPLDKDKEMEQSNTVPKSIYREYLSHPLGLTLSTPSLFFLQIKVDKIRWIYPDGYCMGG